GERKGPRVGAVCRVLPFRLEGEDLSVPQRLHRFLRQVSHLAITLRARHSLGPGPQLRVHQRRSDLHLEVLPPGEDRSFGQRLVGPPQVERQQVDLVGEGEIADGRLELQQLASGRAGPFGKDQQVIPLLQRLARQAQRLAQRAVPIHWNEVGEIFEVGALERCVEKVVARRQRGEALALFSEHYLDQPHVQVTGVVGDHQEVAVLRNEVLAPHLHIEHAAVEDFLAEGEQRATDGGHHVRHRDLPRLCRLTGRWRRTCLAALAAIRTPAVRRHRLVAAGWARRRADGASCGGDQQLQVGHRVQLREVLYGRKRYARALQRHRK